MVQIVTVTNKWLATAIWAGVIVAALANACCTPPLQPDVECATQPRTYVDAAGNSWQEIDHYASTTPCPVVPIR
jgi:hypothetical protein